MNITNYVLESKKFLEEKTGNFSKPKEIANFLYQFFGPLTRLDRMIFASNFTNLWEENEGRDRKIFLSGVMLGKLVIYGYLGYQLTK